MKALAPLLLACLALPGCATAERSQPCPPGQELLSTARFFLGRRSAPATAISDEALARFVEEEITPKFPDGVSVVAGGARWTGENSWLMRDAAKVVMIVLPSSDKEAGARLAAVRHAYQSRFRQEAALLITPPACASLNR